MASFSPKRKLDFFMNADVDGRQTEINTGPSEKDGGMFVRFFMLDKGEVVEAFRVVATTTDPEGKLTYNIVLMKDVEKDEGVDHVLSIRTER